MELNHLKTIYDLVKRYTNISNVYTKPPATLTYPCIVISIDSLSTPAASNSAHHLYSRYKLHYITTDLRDTQGRSLLKIPGVFIDRAYISQDNLYNEAYTIHIY